MHFLTLLAYPELQVGSKTFHAPQKTCNQQLEHAAVVVKSQTIHTLYRLRAGIKDMLLGNQAYYLHFHRLFGAQADTVRHPSGRPRLT